MTNRGRGSHGFQEADRLARIDVRDVVVLGRSRPFELLPRLGSRPELLLASRPLGAEAVPERSAAELRRPILVLQPVVDARVERLCLVAGDDPGLSAGGRSRLLGEQERRSHPSAGGSSGQDRCEPPSAGDSARRQDRPVGQLEDELQEGQRPYRARVAAGVGSLGDHDVDARLDRRRRPVSILHLRGDEDAGLVQPGDIGPRVAERDADQRWARLDRPFEELGPLLYHPRDEADPKGHGRPLPHDRELLFDLIGRVRLLDPDHPEATRLAHGAREPTPGLRSHRRVEKWNADAEDLGEGSLDQCALACRRTSILSST